MADDYYYLTTVPSRVEARAAFPDGEPVPDWGASEEGLSGEAASAAWQVEAPAPEEPDENPDSGPVMWSFAKAAEPTEPEVVSQPSDEGLQPGSASDRSDEAPVQLAGGDPSVGPIRLFVPVAEEAGETADESTYTPPVNTPQPVVKEAPSEPSSTTLFPVSRKEVPAVEEPEPVAALLGKPEAVTVVSPLPDVVQEKEGSWVSAAALALSIVLFFLAGAVVVAQIRKRRKPPMRMRLQPRESIVSGGRRPGTTADDVVVISPPGRPEPSGLGTTPVLFPDSVPEKRGEGASVHQEPDSVPGPAAPPVQAEPETGKPAGGFDVKAPPKPGKLF